MLSACSHTLLFLYVDVLTSITFGHILPKNVKSGVTFITSQYSNSNKKITGEYLSFMTEKCNDTR